MRDVDAVLCILVVVACVVRALRADQGMHSRIGMHTRFCPHYYYNPSLPALAIVSNISGNVIIL